MLRTSCPIRLHTMRPSVHAAAPRQNDKFQYCREGVRYCLFDAAQAKAHTGKCLCTSSMLWTSDLSDVRLGGREVMLLISSIASHLGPRARYHTMLASLRVSVAVGGKKRLRVCTLITQSTARLNSAVHKTCSQGHVTTEYFDQHCELQCSPLVRLW